MMQNSISKTLSNSSLMAVLCLGFASGLPLALVGSTLQAWFTEAHIDLVTIGALSLLGAPYAPGGRPSWINMVFQHSASAAAGFC